MDERRLLAKAIAETRAAFVQALKDGDARAVSGLYADDARMLAPSAELVDGREAIESFWRAGVQAGISDVELVPLQLEHADGLAYEIGRYALSVEAPDGMVVDRGKYLLVHARQTDGSWRRAAEMFSPDGPPAVMQRNCNVPGPGFGSVESR
jgi:uncharacterized protein (TIGR02246 family)